MPTLLLILVALAIAALFSGAKASRPDGDVLKVHPYRRLMAFIMPTRNESLVYYEDWVDAAPLEAFVEAARARGLACGPTHVCVAAVNVALAQNPRLNRFVSGGRVYARRGRHITFSMKRKKLDASAKLAVVKLRMDDAESFDDLCARIAGSIGEARSGEKTYADREFALLDALPGPLLGAAVALARRLDRANLLPGAFIEGDGLFTSVFIANLGSLGMGAASHHLYEWGNCPLFITVGAAVDRPVVEGGEVVARRQLPLRFTYDERIDDGLTARAGIIAVTHALGDPGRWLGAGAMAAPPDGDAEAAQTG